MTREAEIRDETRKPNKLFRNLTFLGPSTGPVGNRYRVSVPPQFRENGVIIDNSLWAGNSKVRQSPFPIFVEIQRIRDY